MLIHQTLQLKDLVLENVHYFQNSGDVSYNSRATKKDVKERNKLKMKKYANYHPDNI